MIFMTKEQAKFEKLLKELDRRHVFEKMKKSKLRLIL